MVTGQAVIMNDQDGVSSSHVDAAFLLWRSHRSEPIVHPVSIRAICWLLPSLAGPTAGLQSASSLACNGEPEC